MASQEWITASKLEDKPEESNKRLSITLKYIITKL